MDYPTADIPPCGVSDSLFETGRDAAASDMPIGGGLMKRFGVTLLVLCSGALVSPSPAQDSTHSSGWIVIPANEYGTLRARAYPAAGDSEAATPVDATLTRVDYNLQISGELASGRASLTVDVLKDGWVRVPIPGGLLVREARLDGKLVSLVDGGGHPAAL